MDGFNKNRHKNNKILIIIQINNKINKIFFIKIKILKFSNKVKFPLWNNKNGIKIINKLTMMMKRKLKEKVKNKNILRDLAIMLKINTRI